MKLVIGTRLHLGKASTPPSEGNTKKILSNLKKIAADGALAKEYKIEVLIAVDATPKLEGYDYVQAVQEELENLIVLKDEKSCANIHILPVRPWGMFVPGLNALILHAKNILEADLIMFVSAEVQLSFETVRTLCQHVIENENVIVAGAALKGHQYHVDVSATGGQSKLQVVPLTGRTTPWNTLCVWDLHKLSLTGFSLVSDLGKSAGVEECVAIALLQKLFPNSEARLVKINGIEWEETFQDEKRQQWHSEKMKSKVDRPKNQLNLLGLSGNVIHC